MSDSELAWELQTLPTFAVSVPAYRGTVRAEHVYLMREIWRAFPASQYCTAETPFLDWSRNNLLLSTINLDYCLMMDADVYPADWWTFVHRDLHRIHTRFLADPQLAMVGVPVATRQRPDATKRRWNAYWERRTHEEWKQVPGYSDLNPTPLFDRDYLALGHAFVPVDVIGTGAVVISNAWVRKNWVEGPWFRVILPHFTASPPMVEGELVGEDVYFSRGVRIRGGRIEAYVVPEMHHV